jgi:serine/threonine protein kinase
VRDNKSGTKVDEGILNEFQELMQNAKTFEDKYSLLEVIYTTGHSTIYKAMTQPGEFCIVKKVSPMDQGGSKEYELLKSITHEAIPKVHDIYETVDATYIVMDWIEGLTLADYVKSKEQLAMKEVIFLMNPLCDVVTYLHTKSLVHRDIKPQNIIISEGKVFLIDYDAARHYKEDSAGDTEILGTSGYAPPEQYGYYQTNYKSDVYALGATFYYMLTGRTMNYDAIMDLSDMGYKKSIIKIIKKATAFDPSDRYDTVEKLKASLGKVEGSPKGVKPYLIIGLGIIAISCFAIYQFGLPDIMGDGSSEPAIVTDQIVSVDTSIEDEAIEYIIEDALSGKVPIQFTDSALEAIIRDQLGIVEGPLYIKDTGRVTQINVIGKLRYEDVTKINFEVGDPSVGEDFVKSYEDADGNKYTERGRIKSLDDLVYMPNCNSITILKNEISDINGLAYPISVFTVMLSDNYITDIEPIIHTKVKGLYFSANRIEDISCIEPIVNQLETVYLPYNLIQDMSVLDSLDLSPWMSDLEHNDGIVTEKSQTEEIDPWILSTGAIDGNYENDRELDAIYSGEMTYFDLDQNNFYIEDGDITLRSHELVNMNLYSLGLQVPNYNGGDEDLIAKLEFYKDNEVVKTIYSVISHEYSIADYGTTFYSITQINDFASVKYSVFSAIEYYNNTNLTEVNVHRISVADKQEAIDMMKNAAYITENRHEGMVLNDERLVLNAVYEDVSFYSEGNPFYFNSSNFQTFNGYKSETKIINSNAKMTFLTTDSGITQVTTYHQGGVQLNEYDILVNLKNNDAFVLRDANYQVTDIIVFEE